MVFGPNTFRTRLESAQGMESEFRAGDFVYVDPDLSPRGGDYVTVRLAGEALTVRRFVEADGRRMLRALGPDVPDRVLDAADETTIEGVVVVRGE